MPKTSTSRTPAKSRTAAPQKKARKQLTSGPTHSWCMTPEPGLQPQCILGYRSP